MKIAYLVGDGMGDYPVPELGDRSPLQAAHAPYMRRIAAAGELRMVKTAPDSLPPGSDVCNLALMGYNAEDNYTGRAPIEAAGMNLSLKPTEVAFRCNLVTVQNDIMIDHSSDHISTEESHALIDALAAELERPGIRFEKGVSYRHLLIWDQGPADAVTEPPHEILEQQVHDYLPHGEGEVDLCDLLERSKAVLQDHPINQARVAAGKNPATQMWLWGQGRAMTVASYKDLYGITGSMITAVDLLRGLGVLAGLDVLDVPGATGFVDTNYQGKVDAALNALERQDFVYVHVEAPDECGHQGDAALKTQAISDFDAKVVGPIWLELERRGEPYRIIVTMDHRTPVSLRGHSREPVPMAALDGPAGHPMEETAFDETVNNGESQGYAFEWVRELLDTRTQH